jgi:hypothetical protein
VHEGLRAGIDARRAPLDQVARHREGCAGEADQGDPERVELPGDQAHGLEHVPGVGFGLQGPQSGQVGAVAERTVHDRPPTLLDLHTESHRRHRHHDVAEEDGGVDAVAAHGLQGELGRQVGLADGVEDAAFAPGDPVFGQGAARLAHEPDRDPVHRLAPAGSHERRVGDWHARDAT